MHFAPFIYFETITKLLLLTLPARTTDFDSFNNIEKLFCSISEIKIHENGKQNIILV